MKEGNLIWEHKNVFQDFQHETTFKGKKKYTSDIYKIVVFIHDLQTQFSEKKL